MNRGLFALLTIFYTIVGIFYSLLTFSLSLVMLPSKGEKFFLKNHRDLMQIRNEMIVELLTKLIQASSGFVFFFFSQADRAVKSWQTLRKVSLPKFLYQTNKTFGRPLRAGFHRLCSFPYVRRRVYSRAFVIAR